MQSALFSTAYLPNLTYLSALLQTETVVLEAHEHFIRQSYRNRAEVLTSNGRLALTIPLHKQSEKEIISNKQISYAENWQHQHWRTITSSYKSSPYFEFFEDDLRPFYEQKYELLFDYNSALLKTILHILRVKKDITLTNGFEPAPINYTDLRSLSSVGVSDEMMAKPYYQVFADKQGFTSHLSCIDALFNVGLETLELSGLSVERRKA